ncbi:hypothetical protein LCGC14_0405760 [marine sediment metagenome]|uniref:HTH psq-type domain-containing protein n=1 Tax=marine sediment metagenome TaxID=412755 RepID=A0A0F9TDC1_9ZZZZ
MKQSKSIILQRAWKTYERNLYWIKLIKRGYSQVYIAKEYGVSRQCVNQVWKRRKLTIWERLDLLRKKVGI